jgi:hypothetical protein
MKIGNLYLKVICGGLLVAVVLATLQDTEKQSAVVIATLQDAEKQSGGPLDVVFSIPPGAVAETNGHDDTVERTSDLLRFALQSSASSGVITLPDELAAGVGDGVIAVNSSGIVTVVRPVVDLVAVAEDPINRKQLPDSFVSYLS